VKANPLNLADARYSEGKPANDVAESFGFLGYSAQAATRGGFNRDYRAYRAPNPNSVDDSAKRISAFTVEHKALLEYLGARVHRWNFAHSLVEQFSRTGSLSSGQIETAYRCMREDAQRAEQTPLQAPAKAPTQPRVDAIDLRHVPAGRYAVPSGETRLKVLIAKPTDDPRRIHWIFVSDAAEYGNRRKYGSQRPGGSYRGLIEKELAQIAADPKAAAIAYGRLTGKCCVCGRTLEDAESIARGIGPICAQKF
jgi:hypothetical protein